MASGLLAGWAVRAASMLSWADAFLLLPLPSQPNCHPTHPLEPGAPWEALPPQCVPEYTGEEGPVLFFGQHSSPCTSGTGTFWAPMSCR